MLFQGVSAECYQMPEFGSSCRHSEKNVKYKVEDIMVEVTGSRRRIGGNVRKCMIGLRGWSYSVQFLPLNLLASAGLIQRLKICRKIWVFMLSLFLTYMVTMSLFPGIESEIESCFLGEWMPIILMATFNLTDLLGKVLIILKQSLNSYY